MEALTLKLGETKVYTFNRIKLYAIHASKNRFESIKKNEIHQKRV